MIPTYRTALAALLLAGTALPALAQTGAVNPPAAVAPRAVLPDFSGLVSQVRPAVVSITSTITQAKMEGPARQELPFPFNQMVPRAPSGPQQARGSGFIIRPDGLIVTNNHVVKDATVVTVTLDDGTELRAKVLGTDKRTDIAVLKVQSPGPLPFITLGNSRNVKPGEWVVAMGNPFGLGGSVTAGIVSAVSRDIGQGPYDQFIQVDAPINHGNSGGPLFTQDGKVIGMNTAIFSPSGGSVGIGFAIPSDLIRTVTDQLAATGHVTRGYVGVAAQPLTGAMAKALHVPENSGVLLASVVPGSPAARAGLTAGDVIDAINGQKIATPRDLALTVSTVAPGTEARVHVLRDGQARDVSVRVADLPAEKIARSPSEDSGDKSPLGLALAPLTPAAREQLDMPEGVSGVLVRGVTSGSAAATAGLRAGDVILGVGPRKVGSPADAAKAIGAALTGKDRTVALRVLRDGMVSFVGVAAEDSEG